MNIIPVILAGGIGERFWPLSRSSMPKQLHSLISDKTMIEETLNRVSPLCPEDKKPLIVTSEHIAQKIREILSTTIDFELFGEPEGKNTAPAIALAAAWIEKQFGDSVMVIVSADHAITPKDRFISTVRYAATVASETDQLIVFGIKPTRAETGYGYIQPDKQRNCDAARPLFKVKRFVEKPTISKANEFFNSGDYYWNSGMFVWRSSVILSQLKQYMPQLYKQTQTLAAHNFTESAIRSFYSACSKESIDCGVLEHSESVSFIAGDFNWDDIGSWESLTRLEGENGSHTTVAGPAVYEKECSDSLIVNKSGLSVAAIGLKGVAVVAVDDALLVIERSKLPDLKKYLQEIKSSGRLPEDLF